MFLTTINTCRKKNVSLLIEVGIHCSSAHHTIEAYCKVPQVNTTDRLRLTLLDKFFLKSSRGAFYCHSMKARIEFQNVILFEQNVQYNPLVALCENLITKLTFRQLLDDSSFFAKVPDFIESWIDFF